MSYKHSKSRKAPPITAISLVILFSANTFGATLSGRVVDIAGKPIAGVAVMLEGQGKNATSKLNIIKDVG